MATDPLPLDALDLLPEEIDARFRNARERGRPEWLWPEVPMREWRAALDAIADATGAVLQGAPSGARNRIRTHRSADRAGACAPTPRSTAGPTHDRVRPSRTTGDGSDADAVGPVRFAFPSDDVRPTADPAATLSVAAYTSGLGPLLGHWLEARRLEAAPACAAVLELHLRHGRRRAERGRRLLADTLEILTAAGVPTIALKGAHTARAYFPEPGARPSSDIDLLVGPDALAAAERALSAAGHERAARQPRLGRSTWTPPDGAGRLRSLRLVHADDPYAIDLHGSLDRHFGVRMLGFGTVTESMAEPWPAVHPAGLALAHPYRAAYLALHVSNEITGATLLRLVELVLVARADLGADPGRWSELRELLAGADALRFVYPAFELVERLTPGTLDPAFRAELDLAATPRMRRLVGRLGPAGAQRLGGLSLEERFMWAAGPVEHLRRALHMVWPARIGSPVALLKTYGERVRRLMGGGVGWRGGANDV